MSVIGIFRQSPIRRVCGQGANDPRFRHSHIVRQLATHVLGGGLQDLYVNADGGGASGMDLESEIKNRWIKLPPNAVYTTKVAEAKSSLNQPGDWRLRASYHPPVGAFSRDYDEANVSIDTQPR
jgi:hypothetical protein